MIGCLRIADMLFMTTCMFMNCRQLPWQFLGGDEQGHQVYTAELQGQ